MKRSVIFISLLALSMLIVSGCGSNEQQRQTGAFLGGTQGAVTQFEPFGVEEQGIFAVYDTETFPIEVVLRNKGEYEIQPADVTVRLLGPSPEEVTGIPSRVLQNQNVIDKISELVPNGGEEVITFGSEAQYTSPVNGFIEREWFASTEYRYKTFVIIPEVCLKEDLTDRRICTVPERKTFFVSGAPVTITSVEEDTAGRGIMALRIKVKDVGGGDVTKPGAEFGVRDELIYSLDDPAWECKSGGRVNEARLQNDEAEIVCKLKEPLQEGDLFTKQVTLTLDYHYRGLIQEKLRIKESAG